MRISLIIPSTIKKKIVHVCAAQVNGVMNDKKEKT